jgi:uncharacterized OB-fold protein
MTALTSDEAYHCARCGHAVLPTQDRCRQCWEGWIANGGWGPPLYRLVPRELRKGDPVAVCCSCGLRSYPQFQFCPECGNDPAIPYRQKIKSNISTATAFILGLLCMKNRGSNG